MPGLTEDVTARVRVVVEAGAYIAGLAWAPDGERVAYAADDGAVGVVDVAGTVERVAAHDGGALAVGWSMRGDLASAGRDGRVVIGGRAVVAGRGWVERIAWRPDGGLLAAAQGRRVSFWAPDGTAAALTDELPATVSCLGWHPKGVTLAAGTYGGVRLIRANGARIERTLAWRGSILELAISPDGRRLAHGNQDASVHFWDLRRQTELEMAGYATKVRELAWSPDGRWLATGGGDSIVCWDFHRPGGPAGSRPLELVEHEERVTSLAFQPGGRLLASTGRDGLLLLWRPGSGTAAPHGGTVADGVELVTSAWSSDGRRLAAGGADGTLIVVDVEERR